MLRPDNCIYIIKLLRNQTKMALCNWSETSVLVTRLRNNWEMTTMHNACATQNNLSKRNQSHFIISRHIKKTVIANF